MHTQRLNSDRPRMPRDLYPTPHELCRAALFRIDQQFLNPKHVRILDPGCGDGIWGKAANEIFSSPYIVGVEINPNHPKYGDSYDEMYKFDYLKWETEDKFDLVCGNPPFGLATEFVEKSYEHLYPNGCRKISGIRGGLCPSQKYKYE